MMKSLIMFAAILSVPTLSLAQSQTTPAPSTGMQTSPQIPSQSDPAMPVPQAQIQPADPATILKNEFAFYDKDKSGELDKTEFSTWLMTLKAKQAAPSAAIDVQADTKWAADSFVKADTDKNKTVSVVELTTHLIPAS